MEVVARSICANDKMELNLIWFIFIPPPDPCFRDFIKAKKKKIHTALLIDHDGDNNNKEWDRTAYRNEQAPFRVTWRMYRDEGKFN